MPTLTAPDCYQRRFEHDRVKMLLAALDLPGAERRLRVEQARDAGQPGADGYLTFDGLSALDYFSDCPVRLGALSVSGSALDRVAMPYLLDFGNTFLYRMYLARWSGREPGDGRPFGLVFSMPNVRGGVVVHDADLPGVTGRTTLTYKPPFAGEPAAVTLEPYKLFLRRLVRHWRGGTPVPPVAPREAVRPRLERWMVGRLGTGPALVVFAWLSGGWRDPDRRFVTVRGGSPCLSLTQPVIARQTGLGADSVKRALADLKREGLIDTRRGDRRTYVTVVDADGDPAAEGG